MSHAFLSRDRMAPAVIHDLHAVQAWCTHTLLLNRDLIAFGPTGTVLNEDNRRRCHGGRRT